MAQAAILSEAQKTSHWREAYRWFVGMFYFFQGFYVVGVNVYILTMMANWEVPATTQVTVLAIISVPTYIKMFPGLLSDRVPLGRWGRRKPYIFIGGLFYVPGFILLIVIQQYGTAWLGAILLTLVAWMLVDSTLDALTVDITPLKKTAQMQSAAWGSRMLGTAITGLLAPILGPRIGWTPMLVIFGSSALIQSGMALLLREIPVTRETLKEQMPIASVMREAFGRPLVWTSIAFILLFSATRGFANIIHVYLLTELGWNSSPRTMQTYGLLLFAVLLANAVGAFLVSRLPPKWLTSLKYYAVYLVAFWIMFIPWLAVDRGPENLALIFGSAIPLGFIHGMGMTLTLTLAMRVCPKSIEGFVFAIMMSAISFGNITIGPKTATAFSDRLGLIPSIFTLIPYGLLSLVFLYPMLKALKKGEQEAAREAAS